MSVFDPAASQDGRLKKDTDAQGAFGNLGASQSLDIQALLSANPELQKSLEQRGVDVKGLEGSDQALDALTRATTGQFDALMKTRGQIERGEQLQGTNKSLLRNLNKIMGGKSEGTQEALRRIDSQIANLLGSDVLMRRKLAPSPQTMALIAKQANDIRDTASRNQLMDSTEAHFKQNPDQGRVIPWMAEAFRQGVDGAQFEDAIAEPFEDQFFKDPAALNSFGDAMHDLGTRSVNVDGTVNDSMLEVIEMLGSIPGITENAAGFALNTFRASQAQALAEQKKGAREDAAKLREKEGVEGKTFAVTDAGVRHMSTPSTDWRVDAENDFGKFRMFVALQNIGVVERTTEFDREFDIMNSLRIFRESGGQVADIKNNPDVWVTATARALDQFSGPFHTPHLFGFVTAENPELAQTLLNSPEFRPLIGLQHLPSLGPSDEAANRSDLRGKSNDLSEALKELDGRTEAE